MSAKSASKPSGQTEGLFETGPRPCGFARRMLVMLYDALIILALMMVATVPVVLAHPATLMAGKDLWYTLYLIAVWFLYLAWCWQRRGLTLGMRAWRVQLLTDSTKPMGWLQCGLRFITSFVSALPLGAGFLWSIVDRESRAWHDHWSRSRLCRTQPPA